MSLDDSLADWIAQHRRLGETRLREWLLSLPSERVQEWVLPLQRGDQATRKDRTLAEWMLKHHVEVVLLGSARYPARLRQSLGNNAPAVLYVLGRRELLDMEAIAIIGTRRPSREGRAGAASYAASLVQKGLAIVSGNAPGIDAAAHQGAITAGGATIVFPPVPIEQFTPSFTMTPTDRVVIASPFVPGDELQPWCFLRRNTLVAAMCNGALVAETGTRGGTVDTIRKLKTLQRPDWVIELPMKSRHSAAHRLLISGGATPVALEPSRLALEQMLRQSRTAPAPRFVSAARFFDAAEHQ